MKRFIIVLLLLTGCSTGTLEGQKPPQLQLIIEDRVEQAVLGTYCWGNQCEDALPPKEIVENISKVQPNTRVQLKIGVPLPTDVELTEVVEDQQTITLKIEEQSFIAPSKPGTYYYNYSAWWKVDGAVQGDAHYAFALEVE